MVTFHSLLSICQQMEKKTTTSLRLNGYFGVRATFNRMWHPEGLACPPPSALKRWTGHDRTITALQQSKKTCCCVGMNAHGPQLKSLSGSLLGDTRYFLFMCRQMKKQDNIFLALEWKRRSESNIQENVTPWRPSMPSAKCLKKMEWTIMALQPCK